RRGLTAGQSCVGLGNGSKPTTPVYRPAKGKATGAAVVVCPGGAYRILAWDLEGTEVCDWLVKSGVTAVLLKYRVPSLKPRGEAALMDAQRALSLVRSKAKEWGVDPKRVAQLGFSAGGPLVAMTALADKRAYKAIDDVDRFDCKPNFCVLVYPAYLANETKDGLADGVKVTKAAPPMFLVHAKNDPVT